MCYFMGSNAYYTRLLNSVTGTTRKRISRKNLGNVELDIPSKREQEKGVKQLDCLVKVISSRITELQRLDDSSRLDLSRCLGIPVLNDKVGSKKSLGRLLQRLGSSATPREKGSLSRKKALHLFT